jgi:hypothetical protein
LQHAVKCSCFCMQLLPPVSGHPQAVYVTASFAIDTSVRNSCNCTNAVPAAQVCAVWAVLTGHCAGVVSGGPRVGLQDRRGPGRHQALQVRILAAAAAAAACRSTHRAAQYAYLRFGIEAGRSSICSSTQQLHLICLAGAGCQAATPQSAMRNSTLWRRQALLAATMACQLAMYTMRPR